ncbi:ABC transporter substrate-binding protein, partial [Pseudomonas aeruginosa]|nr:ABC transporter substrate-binding protein [Pseudomonas aeruginosa]
MSTLSTDQLLHAYRVMRTIRAFEERLHVEFATGEIPGFVHLYAGEEASAAGVMAHLRDDDCIASTHRGHGHCIAKGVDVHGMMAEIYGKKTGVCQGKGGSMHIADLEKGMLGANGIVGARPPPGPRPPPGGPGPRAPAGAPPGGGGGGTQWPSRPPSNKA